ncbi:MAG: class I SAM-dependent methyltransferase [Gemmatimonadales bacterium]
MTTPPRATLERIVPDALEADSATGRATLELHLARYHFAVQQLRGGRVLDLACGVGYGSAVLAQAPGVSMVVGGDISLAALRHARRHYADPAVRLGCGSYADWLRPASFDGIVSLETIEHVPDPALLLQQFARALRPGGILVASVPVTPSVDANPHHLTDFTPASFRSLCQGAGFVEVASMEQVQPYSPIRIVTRQEERVQDMRQGLLKYYAAHPGAAIRRVLATLRYGFTNRYLTVAWAKPLPTSASAAELLAG